MKAAIYERYGPPDVVHVAEIDMPVCGPDEVLVRVHAATVSSADWRARTLGMPPGFGLLARPMFGFKGPRNKDLAALATSGRFTPVIDSIYPLAEIVAAHKKVDTGHKRGNVVILMAPARLNEDKETAQ